MSLVSVVIPTYNGGEHLLESVKSALQQTYAPLEIIVVDDGSQEDILGILSPVSSRVRYIRQENAGPAAARNRGIYSAQGEFIAFLDDDDLWNPRKIEAQMRTMSENPDCGLVYSHPDIIDDNGVVIYNQRPKSCPSGYVYYDFLRKNRISTPSVTLIRSSVFRRSGVFDEKKECISCEDYDLWLRIAQYFTICFCGEAIAYYRQSASGVSRNNYNHLSANLYVMHKMLTEYISSEMHREKIFGDAIGEHVYNIYRKFAYRLYYENNDRASARILLATALRRNPTNFHDIIFLLVCSMPRSLFLYTRNIKRRLLDLKPD